MVFTTQRDHAHARHEPRTKSCEGAMNPEGKVLRKATLCFVAIKRAGSRRCEFNAPPRQPTVKSECLTVTKHQKSTRNHESQLQPLTADEASISLPEIRKVFPADEI